ncbi:leucine--tRNA ligase [Methanobacterium paludis]|uniref:Leucine--tRNA ligase n=1 Tax=Methanobacterium paludis (strain DSM 25820 / JCM 18151 / SWAN1) TaxID=868131 RepID=F6D7Q0_METPW|nr:leucine--tRNA ligase [Methanobacterium paludis]AEG17129.1 leucyl-tRNA synthetase [Methanobacterium paludis]
MTDIKVEEKWQKKWQEANLFESDPNDKEKIFITVAFPYPSGAMHVGHGRTYTVPDVYARFKRMQGYNVLFPMAWHVTGAPVLGIAKRIKRQDPWTLDIYKNVHKVPEDELQKFVEPEYIVKYFSEEYHDVMTRMGYSIDWRREFNTIDPHYQKFVEWQFRKLKDKGLVRIGEHPVKYCPECGNPVGDHDLLEGEGVGINELTLVKFEMDGDYLVAATFRPETLFGATNLWLNPESEYIKIKVDDENWIISRNAYDNILNQKKDTSIVSDVDAPAMIGKYVKNPLTGDEHIILPASFVDPEYATGVVYSVPGHAPADYIALMDLKKDAETLKKYGITDEVKSIRPVGMINLKGFGEIPAEEMIQKFDVENQNHPNLKEATNEIYKLEHAKGIMSQKTGEYEGLSVSDARDKIIDLLRTEKKGDVMHEFSERPVICRCGTKCVVKILDDQWFLKYSDEDWTEKTYKCLEGMNIVPEEVRANFQYYIDWLQDWACSRRIGLGTDLPWNKKWIIEPLSDSTIYMAYYTIAKYMKDIDPEALNDQFFDEVFLGKSGSFDGIDAELFKDIKDEFNYWYPLNWRLSAKDLVGNHLSFHMFHHAAIFPEDKWPRGIVVFGMGLLEGNKMSSSKGNIVMLEDAIETYGSDVVRLFLMSSAEPWQDFDWREKEVRGISKRLNWFMEFADRVEEICGSKIELDGHESAPEVKKSINAWILSQLNMRIRDATTALEGFQTRKALQESLFLLKKDMDHYFHRIEHELDDEESRREIGEVLVHLLGIWIRLMAPFVPHAAEELWKTHGGKGFASEASWPQYNPDLINDKVQKAEEIVQGLASDINEIKNIIDVKPNKVHIYVAPDWKWRVFDIAKEVGKPDIGRIMGQAVKQNVYDNKKEIAGFAKKIAREMTRINYVGQIDEYSIIKDSLDYLSAEVDAEVIVYDEPTYDPEGKSGNASPYKPAIYIE